MSASDGGSVCCAAGWAKSLDLCVDVFQLQLTGDGFDPDNRTGFMSFGVDPGPTVVLLPHVPLDSPSVLSDQHVRWLAEARDAYLADGREEEWRAYLDELIDRHQRKYKLRPMLEDLGKR